MLLGDILYEPAGQLQHPFFPTTAIASLHYVMATGASPIKKEWSRLLSDVPPTASSTPPAPS